MPHSRVAQKFIFLLLGIGLCLHPKKSLSADPPCAKDDVTGFFQRLTKPLSSFIDFIDTKLKEKGNLQFSEVTRLIEENSARDLEEWEASLLSRMRSKSTYPKIEELLAYEALKSQTFEQALPVALKKGPIRYKTFGLLREALRPSDIIELYWSKGLGKTSMSKSSQTAWLIRKTDIPMSKPWTKDQFEEAMNELSTAVIRAANSEYEFKGLPGRQKWVEIWNKARATSKMSNEDWALLKSVGNQLQKDYREQVETAVKSSVKENFSVPKPDENFIKEATNYGIAEAAKMRLIAKAKARKLKLTPDIIMKDPELSAEVKKISDTIRFLMVPIWDAGGVMLTYLGYDQWKERTLQIERERKEALKKLLSTKDNPDAPASQGQLDQRTSNYYKQINDFTVRRTLLLKDIEGTKDPAQKLALKQELAGIEKRLKNLKRLVDQEKEDEELLKDLEKPE